MCLFIKRIIGLSLITTLISCSIVQAADLSVDPETGAAITAVDVPAEQQVPGIMVQSTVDNLTDPEAKHTIAVPTSSPITVGGVKVTSTSDIIQLDGQVVMPESYNIDGYNYFKLRDIAYLLVGKKTEFQVGWDNAAQSILITTKSPYQKDGSEMKATGDTKTTKPSSATVLVDGKNVNLKAYNISGNNYFKLRDIGDALGLIVGYDNAAHTITIDSGTVAETKTYTVTFDMNGQTGSISPLTDVPADTTITAPIARTVNGFAFGGWYLDKNCTQAWDFSNDIVEEDITLYAQWLRSYSVTFIMNGHGTPIAVQSGLTEGSKVTMPIAPTATGFTFDGWYVDSNCSVPWVFASDEIGQNDIFLYAKWLENSDVSIVPPDENTTENTTNPLDPNTPTPEPTRDNSSAIDGQLTILIDPGHGGSDGGTSSASGMTEKEISLSVSLKLRELLQGTGATIVMTRDTDIKLQPSERKATVAANAEHLDMVVVIHHNSANGVAHGAEMLVPTDEQDPSGRSKYLGKLFLSEFSVIGQSGRGLKERPNLYMSNYPASFGIPVAYSEFCFLDNAADFALVSTDEGQMNEAQAMYQAIMKYFETHSY